MSYVLHLFANHKITGPAELALENARALNALGVEARFFSSNVRKTATRDRWLQHLARERQVPEADLQGVVLPKHIAPVRAFLDVRRLAAYLRADPPSVIHCHLPGDHLVAGYAVRKLEQRIPIVRTLYDGEVPEPTFRTRATLGTMTQVLICHSQGVASALRQRCGDYSGLTPDVIRVVPPPIDTTRFDPSRPGIAPRREALGLPQDAIVLGIVARMQTHRRFELLLEAFQRAHEALPNLHLVVIGRGTNQVLVAKEPVQQLGLAHAVHFPGYIAGEDFVRTLASLDAKLFLVPGSDGTCRAVREALAMGLPTIATKRGMLPELVRDGVDGILVDETVESMSAAMLRLGQEAETRARMRTAAREGAVERFALEAFARRLETLYAEAKESAAESAASTR